MIRQTAQQKRETIDKLKTEWKSTEFRVIRQLTGLSFYQLEKLVQVAVRELSQKDNAPGC